MINRIKVIVLAAALLTAFAFVFLERPAFTAGSDRKSSLASSRSLYIRNCARCHGSDGRGDTELGRLNDAPDISGGRMKNVGAARLRSLISRGKGSMPGFGKKLTASQISSLASYVRAL